jgi:hypothetical protein
MQSKRKLVSVRIPVSLYATLTVITRMMRDARGENVAVSELIVQALQQYVERMTGAGEKR